MKHFVLFITILGLVACGERSTSLREVAGTQIRIDSTLVPVDSITDFLEPYRKHLNRTLDSALAYAPKRISKTDGPLNTSAGNLLADLIFEGTQPLFKSRTGNGLDFVLLNHGGIRSIISKGNVSTRTAYEVMPFENTVAVVALTGRSVMDLVAYLVKEKRAHPVSRLKVVLNKEGGLKEVQIQGKPIDEDRTYYIATSSYLVTGGDDMVFFKDALEVFELDYTIRNMMIDYFGKVDTLMPQVDDRFYQLP